MCLLEDSSFVVDYALGKPMLGWTRRALGQRPKKMTPTVSIDEFLHDAEENNARMIAKAVSSGDPAPDEAVDTKVKEEVEIHAIIGPFTNLEDIARGEPVAVIQRHGSRTVSQSAI